MLTISPCTKFRHRNLRPLRASRWTRNRRVQFVRRATCRFVELCPRFADQVEASETAAIRANWWGS
jgi:hypothetical protein